LISACLYLFLGNEWQIWICQLVVYTGYVATSVTTLILLNLSEEVNREDEIENAILKQEVGESFCNSVLLILLLHNIVMTLASGMSIRFIPIFMSE